MAALHSRSWINKHGIRQQVEQIEQDNDSDSPGQNEKTVHVYYDVVVSCRHRERKMHSGFKLRSL
jgi:hypothetical protein